MDNNDSDMNQIDCALIQQLQSEERLMDASEMSISKVSPNAQHQFTKRKKPKFDDEDVLQFDFARYVDHIIESQQQKKSKTTELTDEQGLDHDDIIGGNRNKGVMKRFMQQDTGIFTDNVY